MPPAPSGASAAGASSTAGRFGCSGSSGFASPSIRCRSSRTFAAGASSFSCAISPCSISSNAALPRSS